MKHTFAVLAYGDSPYLRACLRSLAAQTEQSRILLCTSTPSGYIDALAGQFDIPVYVREGEPGIGRDWNFAYDRAETDLVTLAHQDDLYERDYTKTLLSAKEKWPDMSLFTTASVTLKNGKLTEWGRTECVKKLLRMPLRMKAFCASPRWKKSVFLFGNPVICPSCGYDRRMCGDTPFSAEEKFVLDWDFLMRLADLPGRFVCSEKPLIMYRVHEGAATYRCIADHVREREEAEMFARVWPQGAAHLIENLYRSSYEAYTKQ